MIRVLLIGLAVIVLGIIGAGVYFATMPLPAPSSPVEKIIPNERFQR